MLCAVCCVGDDAGAAAAAAVADVATTATIVGAAGMARDALIAAGGVVVGAGVDEVPDPDSDEVPDSECVVFNDTCSEDSDEHIGHAMSDAADAAASAGD